MSLRNPARKQPARQPSPTTGNPALDLFHRNWQALEKLQAKIDKQTLNGRDIYQRFTSDIEPLERQQCELIFALAKRLVDFTARKSFIKPFPLVLLLSTLSKSLLPSCL